MTTLTSFPFPDKCIKLWKITERDRRPEGYNLKDEDGHYREDHGRITALQVRPRMCPPRLMTPQKAITG